MVDFLASVGLDPHSTAMEFERFDSDERRKMASHTGHDPLSKSYNTTDRKREVNNSHVNWI